MTYDKPDLHDAIAGVTAIKIEKTPDGCVLIQLEFSGGSITSSLKGTGWEPYNEIRNRLINIARSQSCTRLVVTVGLRKHTISEAIQLAEKAMNAYGSVSHDWNMERQLDYDLREEELARVRETPRCGCGAALTEENSWPKQCACMITLPTTATDLCTMLNAAFIDGVMEGEANISEVRANMTVVQETADKAKRSRYNSDREFVDRLDKVLRQLTSVRDAKKGTMDT